MANKTSPTYSSDQAVLEAKLLQLMQENQQLRAEKSPSGFDWRTWGMRTALAISVPVIVGASMLVWLNRTIFDPQQYIKTVGPIINETAVQKAITVNASDKLFSEVDVESKIASALPENAQFLAAPVAAQVKTQTTNVISSIVASRQFYNLWIKVNVRAQSAFVKVAKSGNGDPVIDINDTYRFIGTQMQDTRLAPLLARELPDKIGTVEIANIPALQKIPHYAALLDSWRYALVGLAVLLSAAAIALARDRRRGVANVGYAWMFATVLTLVLGRFARTELLGPIASGVNKEAALAIWSSLLHFFYIQLAVTFTLGLAATLAGWYAGSGARATQIRTSVINSLVTARGNIVESDDAPYVAFMQSHRHGFEGGLLALTVITLILLAPLTFGSTLVVFVFALVLLALLEMFAAPSPLVP